jgi:hypothetical protein
MRAFISHSINDEDQYILTLLSSKLRKKEFIITSSKNFYGTTLDYATQKLISESHLFIGIITRQGLERKRVIDEWKFSKKHSIPNILLIEDTLRIQESFSGNYVVFSRRNPQRAIDLITNKMNSPTKNTKPDIVPWILGGAALLAIIGILSENSKK